MFRAGKCPDPEETAGAQPGHGLRDNPEVGPEGESRGVWCSVVLCFVVLSHDVVMFPVPLRCTEVLHQAGQQPPDQTLVTRERIRGVLLQDPSGLL